MGMEGHFCRGIAFRTRWLYGTRGQFRASSTLLASSTHSRASIGLMERTDAILPIKAEYMDRIIRKEKNYEFRRYFINPSVKRIWFYLTAPFSHIAYICEIDPARTRKAGDELLLEDGLGNKEFNERHADWTGYDYAYRVRSVRRIAEPVALQMMRDVYGMKSAPRSLVYAPPKLLRDLQWMEQTLVWGDGSDIDAVNDSYS
ncbi:hypothetical protein NEOLEDRAFT_969146 [Neolentinus lepideus HHB14362 ss-1]|uniref:Uncharacterized protein n=1 Tax=Neolentinus lepideus HHB14362 ss-1 TaxID=1314782 RepID=A0A165NB85_9AGAM|nr:hypothetical protein NEOLEDRAFT_969146 [Neolentinus lepideus HHB14362 ss-1]